MDLLVEPGTNLCGGRTVVGVLGEAAEDQGLKVPAYVGAAFAWRDRSLGDVLAGDLYRGTAGERWFSHGRLVQRRTQGVYVALGRRLLSPELLR
jgi:hypothetical protein